VHEPMNSLGIISTRHLNLSTACIFEVVLVRKGIFSGQTGFIFPT